MSFDWHTEDESWGDGPPEVAKPRPRRPWLRLMPFAILAALLVIAGGATLFRQFESRLDRVEKDVEADVLASNRIVRLAADQRDEALFITVLSGRDPRWAETYRQLVVEGRLIDRSHLGLQLQPDSEADIVELTLSPDLTEANLVTNEHYLIDIGNGLTDMITLQRHDIYRQGPTQWLLAPPLEDESGPWMANEGRYLSLIFPETEIELAKRLSYDLERKLSEMCATVSGLQCDPRFHMTVRLDPDPASLRFDDSLGRVAESQMEMRLPTPSVVGLPVDEPGYQALFRGYAMQIVGAALLSTLNWQCCEQSPFVAAIEQQVLSDLALRPRPISPEMYDVMLEHPTEIGDLFTLWIEQEAMPDARSTDLAGMVVTFLLENGPSADVPELIEALSAEASYWDWILRFMPAEMTDREIERAWLAYLWSQTSQAEATLPIALPEEDLLLLCGLGVRSTTATLNRFSPGTQDWSAQLTDRGFVSLTPLADQSGVLLLEADAQDTESPAMSLTRWQDAELELIWHSGDRQLLYYFGLTEPLDQWLYISARDLEQGQNLLQGFSLQECASQSGCEPVVLGGIAIFAPDNQHALVVEPALRDEDLPALRLVERSGNSLHEIEAGALPFWLNDERYGYVVLDERRDGINIQFAGVETGLPESVLTVAELLERAPDLPERLQSDELPVRIEWVAANPVDENQLFILVGQEASAWDDLFLFDIGAGTISYEFETLSEIGNWPPLHFSPDGDWLVVTTFRVAEGSGEVLLYKPGTGKKINLPLLDTPYGLAWSQDGNWLAKVDGDWLALIAPEYDFQQIVVHEQGSCGPAGWIAAGRE